MSNSLGANVVLVYRPIADCIRSVCLSSLKYFRTSVYRQGSEDLRRGRTAVTMGAEVASSPEHT